MQCITPRRATDDGEAHVLDMASLMRRLATVTDARCPKGVRYALAPVLLLIILAKLSGEDRPSGIADWITGRERLLREALHLSWERMPHHNTYRRILAEGVAPDELDRLVHDHLCSLPGVGHSVVVAIDGKTMRGTMDAAHPRGTHLLAAYLPDEGIVLLQVATGDKENEISVAPDLVRCLDLRGKVVTGDAMHTQRALSIHILQAGGDYLWVAKENQPRLQADIAAVFSAEDRTVLGGRVANDLRGCRTVEKGHGRQERREITVSSVLQGYTAWPGLEQVFKLERCRVHTRGGREEREVVYGLTSLSAAAAGPEQLLHLARTHWGIENGLHRRRDVTFAEDATRLTCGHAGHVMAALNNLVIGVLRHAGETNIAAARRWWDAHFLLALTPSPAGLLE
jgi:predicted transposase YbfD/YdcC